MAWDGRDAGWRAAVLFAKPVPPKEAMLTVHIQDEPKYQELLIEPSA
jgi:hypothetical protein